MNESNSVFISYRRKASGFFSLAVYQHLTANGIDTFYDIENIDQGQFDDIILGEIEARPYFIPVLTPETLERCMEPSDWLYREIQHALKHKRKIVPLHTPEFDFGDISKYLPGVMSDELKRFNAIEVPLKQFRLVMDNVVKRILKPTSIKTKPVSPTNKHVVSRKKKKAAAEPKVTEKQLTAQEYFERGLQTSNLDERIMNYSEAIRLDPEYDVAYYNRGIAYYGKRDYENAIADYSEAIRLNPTFPVTYYNRGIAYYGKRDYENIIADYSKAIELDPKYVAAYSQRGLAQSYLGEHDKAFADYSKAIELDPKYAATYSNRGHSYLLKGLYGEAIADHNEAIQLDPQAPNAYYWRGVAYWIGNEHDKAIADYSEAIRLDPKFALAYSRRALAYAAQKDYKSAVADAEKAESIDPQIAPSKDQIEIWRKAKSNIPLRLF